MSTMTILKHRSLVGTSFFRSLITMNQKGLSEGIEQEPALFETIGTAGVVTLNRPKKVNAMNYPMWKLLLPRLQDWEQNRSHLIIKGAGNAFSAGGDIKWITNLESDPDKLAHCATVLNGAYVLSKYKIPYIALMDGPTFGVGCFMALHGRFRIATERTVVCTPETSLGWITDGSATYLLPRLKNHFGFYMGLTGKQFKGKDAVPPGLATHFIPSSRLHELQLDLCYSNADDIEDRLNAYSQPLGNVSIAPMMRDIDFCFSADTVEDIIERLLKLNNSWSTETVETLARMCPITLKVTLRALQYGKVNDIKQCLRTEYRVLTRLIDSYNAHEGVTAKLVDKNREPKWQPSTLAEVSDSMVDSYFDPLPAGEELSFYDD